MPEIEFFDESDENISSSKAIVTIYRVADGWLPSWRLEVREEADISELLAIREGLELAAVQFDKMLDMLFAEE
jgi:hypothetical protein